jgi:hypothetical protein
MNCQIFCHLKTFHFSFAFFNLCYIIGGKIEKKDCHGGEPMMLVDYNGKLTKLPDFFVVGAARSGTTSLHYYLKKHTEISMPEVKEIGFFLFVNTPIELIRMVEKKKSLKMVYIFDDYIKHFEKALDIQMIGEACNWYLYAYKETIKNIKTVYRENYKNLKIIIILRNPADRAWSHFMVYRRDGKEPIEDFRGAIKPEVSNKRSEDNKGLPVGLGDYIGLGMYYEQVAAYMREFQDVKIFLYDDLCKDALKVVREIYNFLGVSEGFTPNIKKRYNISGESKVKLLNTFVTHNYMMKDLLKSFIPFKMRDLIRHTIFEKNTQRKEMPQDIRSELIKFYEYDIIKLQKLLKRDLSSWLNVKAPD